MWRTDNVIDGVSFIRGHRTLQDEVDQMGIDVCYSSLLDALKAAIGTLPNSLAIFEYMRSIFDSYINPTNDPIVHPLVKGLDADDFSVDKFFGLQDPTSPDDVQASPDFEVDLRTNERLRLRVAVRNLGAKPQRLTRSTRFCLDYEPTILPDVPPTNNPERPVTLDLTVDAHEDPSSSPQSEIVPVLAFVDLTLYTSSPKNEGSEDQGWPALVQMGIMNVEQQQDGHSCGKHVLQMLAGAGMKESKGLDRCFREEGSDI
ncbi:hypothetical protein R1flu_008210 [Riccia fluitans]|uniref:Uncharacterized protein n=1 Tax=Riccia fluitans TaxID=41844 RepID=A0ABD1YB85_9MARC